MHGAPGPYRRMGLHMFESVSLICWGWLHWAHTILYRLMSTLHVLLSLSILLVIVYILVWSVHHWKSQLVMTVACYWEVTQLIVGKVRSFHWWSGILFLFHCKCTFGAWQYASVSWWEFCMPWLLLVASTMLLSPMIAMIWMCLVASLTIWIVCHFVTEAYTVVLEVVSQRDI